MKTEKKTDTTSFKQQYFRNLAAETGLHLHLDAGGTCRVSMADTEVGENLDRHLRTSGKPLPGGPDQITMRIEVHLIPAPGKISTRNPVDWTYGEIPSEAFDAYLRPSFKFNT